MTVPRSGWVKPESDRRLSDLVSVGLLTRVFPADVVDAVVAAAGRTELRQRALPARTNHVAVRTPIVNVLER